MADKKDYYETLELNQQASEAEIKKAYKKLAMKHHPDRNNGNPESTETFKDVKKAYDILSDPQKKSIYDQYGHAGIDQSMGGAGAGAGDFGDAFGDIFGDIFGGSRSNGRSNVYRGADLRFNMEISLEQSAKGTENQIKIPVMISCEPCNGSGAKKGSAPTECGTCHGQGQVRMQQGFFSVQQECPHCNGVGTTIKDPCSDCRGSGRIKETKTLSVKIPVGVDDGDRIRLSGEGEAGTNGGPTGDLYVVISLKEHKIFERDGANLHCEMPISFSTAALGGQLEIPTLDGNAKIKIPAETQTGAAFRLKGKGIKPVRENHVGDLHCHVVVETPVKLTEKQKNILEELERMNQADSDKHSPKSTTWLDTVKDFFE